MLDTFVIEILGVNMENVEKLFIEEKGHFTIFVVTQEFAVNQGKNYFKAYINTEHFINSKRKIKKCIKNTLETIEKSIEPVSSLVSFISPFIKGGFSISHIATETFLQTICKLLTVHQHQAAGPDVIDPIIIQEGNITIRDLIKTINLYKDSILRPAIILILQDNDFDRASEYLKKCPDGTYIKFINSNAQPKIIRVVNSGVKNISEFIDAFSDQCFSTCSKTKREVLLSNEYNDNNIIAFYTPQLLRIRSNLLFDQKTIIKNDLNNIVENLRLLNNLNESDNKIRDSFLCISLLFRVFTNDNGNTDIDEAFTLANSLNNRVLLAQVYRYADFFKNISQSEKKDMLLKGYDVFHNNSMEDHAIYCMNNLLVEQFSTNHVNSIKFKELQEEAIGGVPGMVGLSHIYNNVGIAFLYNGLATTAIDYFNNGLDYAKADGRLVQYLALKINIAIAKCYMFETTEEKDLRALMRQTIDGIGYNLPFIASRYALNIVSIAFSQNPKFGMELLQDQNIFKLVNQSILNPHIGAGQLILQINYLSENYNDFPNNKFLYKENITDSIKGMRRSFIEKYGLNPFHFKTWL